MVTLKQSLTATISLVSFFLGVIPLQAQNGETTFKSNCAVCHTVGGGKLIGPDLIGVTAKRSDTWLIQWIKGSQAMVQNGDPDAIAIFEEYSKIPMPDQNLSDSEIPECSITSKAKGQQMFLRQLPICKCQSKVQTMQMGKSCCLVNKFLKAM